MPPPTLTPPNAADELFPDSFRAEAFDLIPVDALGTPRAFEPVAFSLALRTSYVDAGLVPPVELITVSPSGVHERRELADIPIAVVVYPDTGGDWMITLREISHNQWWGRASFTVAGDPS